MKREDLLDLNEAVQHPGKELTFEVQTDLAHEEDLDLLDTVKGEIRAVSTGNVLLLEGDFSTRCVLECARCSSPLEVEVAFHMDDQFPVEGIPSAYSAEGFAHIVPDEPYPLFHNNSLIKDNYVRQGLLLNIPEQALCPFGWDGPCPNAEALLKKLDVPSGHPAFDKLRQLKQSDKESES